MRDCRPLRTASFKLRKSGFLIKKEIKIKSESVDNDNDDHDDIGVLIRDGHAPVFGDALS